MTQLQKQKQSAECSNSRSKKTLFLRKLKEGSQQREGNMFSILMLASLRLLARGYRHLQGPPKPTQETATESFS